jgi:glycine cleavage system H lipoate-binding protein
MRCPFLKEARVKYCDRSAFRKMIRIAGDVAQETCSSPRYKSCSVYQRYAEDWGNDRCPYLRESPAQYCSTASVTRFIPYNESLLSRCTSEAYRYCDVYMAVANPPVYEALTARQDHIVGGIQMPGWLFYSANHIWVDCGKDSSCHLGIDGFLARVLGSVERITFLTGPGVHRPTAVLSARGVDLEIVFPNSMLVSASNLYLRANPAKLTVDPYGSGWLFEGMQLPGQPSLTSGLVRGEAAVPWMAQEIERISAFFAERRTLPGKETMHDGGVFRADALKLLSREDTLRMFREFFSIMRADHV